MKQIKERIKNAVLKAQKKKAIDWAPQGKTEEATLMARTPSEPIFVTVPVRTQYAMALVEQRAKYIYANPGHCHLCCTNKMHTLYHSYGECKSDISIAARSIAVHTLSQNYSHLIHYITHPTESKLQIMLGAPIHPKLPMKQQAAVTEALLSILQLAPDI